MQLLVDSMEAAHLTLKADLKHGKQAHHNSVKYANQLLKILIIGLMEISRKLKRSSNYFSLLRYEILISDTYHVF